MTPSIFKIVREIIEKNDRFTIFVINNDPLIASVINNEYFIAYSQGTQALQDLKISTEVFYQLRNFFESIKEPLNRDTFYNFERNPKKKDFLIKALDEQIAKEALEKRFISALSAVADVIAKEALEKRFISALSAVADVIKNSTKPSVKNPLTLKLVEIFEEAKEARIEIQKAPNLAQAQREAEDKARSGLLSFFVQAKPIVQARPKSFNIIDFFAEILTGTGFNRIQTYSSVRELFDNAEFNIISNRGLIGQEGLIAAEKQAIPIIRKAIKSAIKFYKNTELLELLEKVLELFEKAVALRASASFDNTPSENVIPDETPDRENRFNRV